MHKTLKALAITLLLLTLPGCAGRGAPNAATLVIIGGGNLDDTPIPTAFLDRVHPSTDRPGEVLVIPTASGVPDESGLGTTLALRAAATRHNVDVLLLTEDDSERADDPDAAARIRDADGIWFTGGDQSRITRVFRPASVAGEDHRALADIALHDMLARGGTVAGTSAGAAMMCHPMIAGGRSETALLKGTGDGGVQIAPGMGLFAFGLIDQHFLQRGRLGRLIAALEATDTRYGFGIEEGKAIVVTLGEDNEFTALGPDSVLIVDMHHAQRDDAGNRTHIRLTLLGTGDRWDLVRGRAMPTFSALDRASITQPLDGPIPDPERDAWEQGAIRDALHALADDPDSPQHLTSEHFTLTFTADADTAFYFRPNNRHDLCAVNVRLDIARR